MKPADPFPKLLHDFFHEWMVQQRNASVHTVRSYRDTWRLFLRFVAHRRRRTVAQLALADLTAHEVSAFLHHAEQERGDTIGTRNCRLAALRSFFGFVAGREPPAIAQCAEWRFDGLPMNVSINLSARDLMDATLPDRVAALLQRHRCAAQWIALEITESAILDDPAHAIRNLERLHALGCRLAIDDYGTGYSSLAYLRRLPVHELKIDKSFVIGMSADASDALIVRSTIDLAHNMGLSVVAEGVEDDATLDRLRSMGCDMVQGYLLSRPMGVAETAVWMRASVWTRPASEAPSLRRVV